MHFLRNILLLFLLLPAGLIGQLRVKNHFGLTGKKDISVKVLTQDLDGYLIFATNEGLYSFDGRNCQNLVTRKFSGDHAVTALFADSRNHIWIGTDNGNIYCFNRKRLDSSVAVKDESREKITSFCELKGQIFAGTYGTGILALSKMQVKKYTVNEGVSDNVIYDLETDGIDQLWAGTDGGITQAKVTGEKILFSGIGSRNGLPDQIVRSLYYSDRKILAGMQDSGYCFIDPHTKKISRPLHSLNWALGPIIHVSIDKNAQLVLGTEENGLVVIRDQDQKNVYDYQSYARVDKIFQAYTDREQQIWLASAKGLSHFISSRSYLMQAGTTADQNKILALTVDKDNTIWVGTAAGFGSINDRGTLEFTQKLPEAQKLLISCAALAPDGNIWFGTYGAGIAVFDKTDNQTKFLSSKSKQLSNDNVSSIYFDNNKVYIATLGGGIDVLELAGAGNAITVALQVTYTQTDGLGSDYVYAAMTGTDGLLYAASDGGGLRQLINGKFEIIKGAEKLKSNTAFSLARDPFGHIVATSNADGILHFDGKQISSYQLKEGLREEQPPQIIASENVLLCVHAKGIDRINCRNNSVTYYDLPDSDFDPTLNAVVYHQGNIYSGTSNGILIFRTSKNANDSVQPLARIREFFLNYKPFPLDSISEFRYNQNSMAFAFGGTWLKDPARLTFRYRLHGFDESWQFSEQGKTVNYNNLNPGNYTFVVQVKNDEDVWSEPSAHAFIILTPIWKRWWFWLLVITAVVLGLYLFIRYRLRALQKENILLERRVKERTQQIEKQTAIIEQKNVELEQLSLVASKTDNVVLILNPDGNLEYINDSFERLNGFGLEKIRGEFGGSIYQLSNNSDIRKIVDEAVTLKKSVHYESLNRKTLSGSEIWESSTLTPIFDDHGALRKIIIIDTDVTLRKKQEQIIVQKNKDITDSIAYARKIQHAILPPVELMQSYIPELFVLYMTKDIVSGDFYWFGHYGDYSIIAAVDCTGHGVPGAFMSLIGYNQLNRIVNEDKIRDPSKILEELNKGVLGVIHKNDSGSRDGMDIAICRINHSNRTLEYAGAMRPLWIVNKEADGSTDLREVKADKIPIGTRPADRSEEIVYHTRFMPLKKNETYYIFTDGYADQFGGARDKKYSTGRFKELLIAQHNKPLKDQEQAIRAEHIEWKGAHEQVDDILVIGFKF